ncbi:MAG: protein-glutamate O-methyltransferase CheR [Lachnospiraceae bacterium]|nr:protein-glutamate O-methyltransferase CheR [Lachnospiraceae bacterium]MBO5145540.1 protein-glutamate O-methyltransferase CheR [Lachnospiraceae bacterium]
MITEQEFQRIVSYVKRKSGINLSEKKVLVQGRLDNYMQRNGYSSYHEFMDLVEKFPNGPEAEDLLNSLTTNHTYFWRESDQFLYLKQQVFPELKRHTENTKDWRIWCAASSTGEEPYTLAMLCMDFLGLEYPEWDTTILATDIDTKVLEKAVRGVYAKNSVEQLPQQYVRRFFRPVNQEQYQVKEELKKQVLFRQFNLMNQLPFRKPLHVVFIRNVMIYFDEKTKEKLLENIYEKMAPGGYLFIGSTESMSQSNTRFRYVRPSIYRK